MKKGLCLVLSALAIVGGTLPTVSYTVDAASKVSKTSAMSSTMKKSTKSSAKVNAVKVEYKTVELAKGDVYSMTYYGYNNLTGVASTNSSVASAKIKNQSSKLEVTIKNRGTADVTASFKDGSKVKIHIIATNYKYSDVFKTTKKTSDKTYWSTCKLGGSDKKIVYRAGKRIKTVKHIDGTKSVLSWTLGKWDSKETYNGYVTFKVNKGGYEVIQIVYTDGSSEKVGFTCDSPRPVSYSPMSISYNQFMSMGVVNFDGKRFTYYSQSVLPGYGLNIPGRHVDNGYVCDGDGYIVLASPNLTTYPRYSVINTPFGKKGKFYDFCPGGSFDVYVQ